MKYVLDSSVAIKTVIQEVDSDKALRLRDDYNDTIHDLIAPDLFPTEICNVLMMAERTGKDIAGRRGDVLLGLRSGSTRLIRCNSASVASARTGSAISPDRL